ncbi:hypothetical protein QQ020_19980 [Fulvivirgaceae bacterium BMA12]|uniref:Glycosyltransferase RgtA/B/C/D-like domain-containing protein n=1 Tax=Agaribacillus aureus TaxID=3051825 RepID=A0ABT8L9D2_9BACT|nr:hypothetical protein [Fulvivirgaceae bacterium BMA12]
MSLKSPATGFLTDQMIIVLALFAASALYFYANINGLGLTNDSLRYLNQSIAFAENHSLSEIGFRNVFPFQSLEIVLLSFLGDHSLTVMKYLHVFLLGGTIFIHLIIAFEILSTAKMRIAYAVTLTFSTPLLMVHSFLWTEPLFILLTSFQWYLLWRFFQHKNLKILLLILLISILYCWQRKAGMLFSLGLVLALVRYFSFSGRQILIIFASLLMLILVLYGTIGTVNLIGERPVLSSIPLNFKNYFGALSGWILPLPLNLWLRIGVLIVAIICISYWLWKTIPTMPEPLKAYLSSILIIVLTYFVIRHFYHRPHSDEADRFLAPLYPGVFFLIIFVMEQIILKTDHHIRKLVFSVMLILWLAYPVARTFKNAELWHNRTKNPLLIKGQIQAIHKK